MHTLYLLRHAKTEDGKDKSDRDRALTPRGVRAAQLMGLYARQQSWQFDTVWVSDALRTRQTWENFNLHLGFAGRLLFRPELYLADAGAIRSMLAELPNAEQRVLCIGHNPGLQVLASSMADEASEPELLDRLYAGLPTGTMLCLEHAGTGWADAMQRQHAAKLTMYLEPADLV
jgi:phosphohistidine phosphatase